MYTYVYTVHSALFAPVSNPIIACTYYCRIAIDRSPRCTRRNGGLLLAHISCVLKLTSCK